MLFSQGGDHVDQFGATNGITVEIRFSSQNSPAPASQLLRSSNRCSYSTMWPIQPSMTTPYGPAARPPIVAFGAECRQARHGEYSPQGVQSSDVDRFGDLFVVLTSSGEISRRFVCVLCVILCYSRVFFCGL